MKALSENRSVLLRVCRVILPVAVSLAPAITVSAHAIEFGLPAACEIGRDCFVQQFMDMDAGVTTRDPFCGSATYEGHKGTDFRVLSLRDVDRGVDVVAMADGTVLRLRDGVPDHLVVSEEDRRSVADRECGNGMIVAHADGYETQYCHLKMGSIAVKSGDAVKRGDPMGAVGASGLAQFPHVHVTVRKDGKEIDPVTGRALGEGCLSDPAKAKPLFSPEVAAAIGGSDTSLLALGLAGGVVDHDALSVDGPPPPAMATSEAMVAWGWFINLRKGDRIRLRIIDPAGLTVTDTTQDPLDRTKASFAAYAGKRDAPRRGTYRVEVALLRDGRAVIDRSVPVTVE